MVFSFLFNNLMNDSDEDTILDLSDVPTVPWTRKHTRLSPKRARMGIVPGGQYPALSIHHPVRTPFLKEVPSLLYFAMARICHNLTARDSDRARFDHTLSHLPIPDELWTYITSHGEFHWYTVEVPREVLTDDVHPRLDMEAPRPPPDPWTCCVCFMGKWNPHNRALQRWVAVTIYEDGALIQYIYYILVCSKFCAKKAGNRACRGLRPWIYKSVSKVRGYYDANVFLHLTYDVPRPQFNTGAFYRAPTLRSFQDYRPVADVILFSDEEYHMPSDSDVDTPSDDELLSTYEERAYDEDYLPLGVSPHDSPSDGATE